jgi:hypothetical protein
MLPKRRSPAVMTNDQDANSVADDAKQKMIRKSFEVHPPEIALADAESFWRINCLLEEGSQLGVELIGELLPGDIFVVLQDKEDVGCNLAMKLEAHQPRRPWM